MPTERKKKKEEKAVGNLPLTAANILFLLYGPPIAH